MSNQVGVYIPTFFASVQASLTQIFFSVPALSIPDGQVLAEVLDANATVMRIELQTNFIGPDGAKAKRLCCDFS